MTSSSGPFDRRSLMWIHWSGLLGFFIPFGGSAFAVWVFWMALRDRGALADLQGRKALNFHLSIILYQSILFLILGTLLLAAFWQMGGLIEMHQYFRQMPMPFEHGQMALMIPIVLLFFLIVLAGGALWLLQLAFSFINGLRSFTEDDVIYPFAFRFLKI